MASTAKIKSPEWISSISVRMYEGQVLPAFLRTLEEKHSSTRVGHGRQRTNMHESLLGGPKRVRLSLQAIAVKETPSVSSSATPVPHSVPLQLQQSNVVQKHLFSYRSIGEVVTRSIRTACLHDPTPRP
jgi:hypothetical protein